MRCAWILLLFSCLCSGQDGRYERLMKDILIFDAHIDTPRLFIDESYRLVETDAGRTLHTAATFLDAADAAFELIDEQDPDGLEIIRDRDGERESVWSYRRETAGFPPDHPSRS